MYHNKFILLIFLFLSLSCDSPVVVDLPHMPPRLVMNGVLQNEEYYTNAIRLSLSSDYLDNKNYPFQNAWVSLYENDQLLETITDSYISQSGWEANYGFLNITLTPGNTYRVEASSDQYETATASYVQPLPVEVDSASLTILGPKPDETRTMETLIRVYIDDPPGANYYILTVWRQEEYNSNPVFRGPVKLTFMDPAYDAESIDSQPWQSQYGLYFLTFTDSKFDGQRKYFDIKSNVFQNFV